jgi:hypothetical protein
LLHLPVKRCLNEVPISLSGEAIGLLAALEGVLLKINFLLLVSSDIQMTRIKL